MTGKPFAITKIGARIMSVITVGGHEVKFKDDSDGCIDTWVEVMRLHLEQDNLNDESQACTAILSNLEGRALKCVVAKKKEERDTADKIFEIMLNRFGSGMKGDRSMMRFEKRRQRDDESISIGSWMILRD